MDIEAKQAEQKIKKWLAIINSMTYEELNNPEILDRSRIRRIAIGAGVWGDRKLEGRRIAIDEYFPDEYVKATKGFLHFAFMDSYNYNKRMGLDQEYFEVIIKD